MYYELYVDSLFLINFVMNLYLLLLVDRGTMRTATRGRLVLGAAAGALLYLLPFGWNARVWLKFVVGMTAGMMGMIGIAFRPGTLQAVAKIVERFFLYSFLMGGFLLFLMECIPLLRGLMTDICGVMGFGAMGFLVISYVQERQKKGKRRSVCKATLIRGGRRCTVSALIDSGNHLVEPVSGKAVSVIDRELYDALWGDEDVLYRAIPYHSIGKRNGILKGFLLPGLCLEVDGMMKEYRDVYVAVSEEAKGEIRMILNSRVLDDIA